MAARHKCKWIEPNSKLIETNNGIKIINPQNQSKIQSAISSVMIEDLHRLPIGICILDNESKILMSNELCLINLGFISEQDSVGKSAFDIMSTKEANIFIEADKHVIKTNQSSVYDTSFVRKDGLPITCIDAKFPFYDHAGSIIGVFGITAFANGDISYMSKIMNTLGLNQVADEISKIKRLTIDNVKISPKQSYCLFLLVYGKTNKEIGKILNLSPRTVETYINILKYKLQCSTKNELIEKAIELGVTKLMPTSFSI